VKQFRCLLLTLVCLAGLAVTAGAGADTKLDITNWKDILPEPAFTKLVEESTGKLTGYTSSAAQFATNAKKVQAEATNLIVYAEVAHRAGNPKAAALREEATKLLEAAKAKKADVAKEISANLAKYKSLSGGSGGDSDLTKSTSLKIIMDVTVKEIDRKLTQYKRITAATLATKQEEITRDMYKLAALSVAVNAHTPTTDLPKGKTGKDWQASSDDMRKHALEAAAAAKAKKANETKTAVNNLAAACAKCHDDFRVQTE
jgi:hypothetical protein